VRIALICPLICHLFVFSARAQEPQLLGIIPSDTINSLFGTEIVPLGDQNGDGRTDILIWDFRFRGGVFYGGDAAPSVPSLSFFDFSRVSGVPGDADGDHIIDITNATRPGEDDRIELFIGGIAFDTILDFRFGVDTVDPSQSFSVISPDLNASGTYELVTQGADPSSKEVVMYELDQPFDSVPDIIFGPPSSSGPFSSFGGRLAIGDFNADGQPDLATSWRPVDNSFSGAVMVYFGDNSFDSLPDLILRRPADSSDPQSNFGYGILLSPGDLNGDSYDDLVASSSIDFPDTLTFVYFGGPSIDTIPDVVISELIDVADRAGDINGDGYADLVTGRPTPLGGFVSLYYGGPEFDSLRDFRIWDSDLPGFHFEVGREVAGIGDYDGDGIDDFALAGISGQKGQVYIFAGFQDPTDVPFDYEPILPSGYELSQNYPNPFNPSTTIQFALPKAGRTELVVYNILGERVTTLINRRLAAGSYTLEWDGTNDQGEPVASGVYVYRLQSGDYTTSRKMVLAR